MVCAIVVTVYIARLAMSCVKKPRFARVCIILMPRFCGWPLRIFLSVSRRFRVGFASVCVVICTLNVSRSLSALCATHPIGSIIVSVRVLFVL